MLSPLETRINPAEFVTSGVQLAGSSWLDQRINNGSNVVLPYAVAPKANKCLSPWDTNNCPTSAGVLDAPEISAKGIARVRNVVSKAH
jgi:hypothetical protein